MVKRAVLLFLCTLLFNSLWLQSEAQAIINGRPLDQLSQTPELLPPVDQIVGLSFRIDGLPDEPCTATFLSPQLLITAAHCFLLNDYLEAKPTICIQSWQPSSNPAPSETCIPFDRYQVTLAPQISLGSKAPTRKLKKVVPIPIPDIALIRLSAESNRNKLSRRLTTRTFGAISMNHPLIFGQGCNAFPNDFETKLPGIGQLRWQWIPALQPHKEGLLKSDWQRGDPHGAVCWGDSGGPVFAQTTDGGFSLVGIISGMKRSFGVRPDGQGRFTEASLSSYSDLRHPQTQQWFLAETREATAEPHPSNFY